MGLPLTLQRLAPAYINANESNNFWITRGNPQEPGTHRLGWVPALQLPALLCKDGLIEHRLNEQWLINLYTFWDGVYRPLIAEQRGVPVNEVVVPPIGDVRHLRNDIIHHRGIATRDNSGKCAVFQHWVVVGRPIIITTDRVHELLDALHLLLTVVDAGGQDWGEGKPLFG
jgi:hypothetical protein